MSRFPKLTETFILFEMLAVEQSGVAVEIFPLLRERTSVIHPEAAPLVERAHFQPFLSPAILASQAHFLLRRPRAYLGALAALMRGTWGSPNYFFGGLAIFPKVVHDARLMEDLGIEHVHCHFSNHPAAAGFVIHRLTGIPYSFTAHGSDLHLDRHMLGPKLEEAAFALTISEDNLREMEATCGSLARARTSILRCGVDTSVFEPPASRPQAPPLRVVCVGTLHAVKGQTYLVDACARLAAAGLDVTCDLVGDGPDEAALRERIAAGGLEDRIRLLGRRTRAQIAELLATSHVLVAPSVPTPDGRREGIPVVLMEAMASGLPVVASRLSGIPELVRDGETGLLAEPADVAGLAAAIRRLAEQPELRARLGAAARATVLADYDLRTNADRLLTRLGHVRSAGAPLPTGSPAEAFGP
ncbi:MAG TPA: glycosyltransferase [Candidatus Limnocylindrales bacterium]|nr:glycosyltransferase [Candidatus Limnocylindrales bacterium]